MDNQKDRYAMLNIIIHGLRLVYVYSTQVQVSNNPTTSSSFLGLSQTTGVTSTEEMNSRSASGRCSVFSDFLPVQRYRGTEEASVKTQSRLPRSRLSHGNLTGGNWGRISAGSQGGPLYSSTCSIRNRRLASASSSRIICTYLSGAIFRYSEHLRVWLCCQNSGNT